MANTTSAIPLRILGAAVGCYLRQGVVSAGKMWLWDRIVRPHFLWRDMQVDARAKFGAVFAGTMRDMIHQRLYFFGVWEPNLTALFRSRLGPGDVVIDVGANVGTHTLLAAALVGPSGRVHAIEASPSVFRRLEANIARNRAGNVVAYNLAAVDMAQQITVFLHADHNLGRSTIVPTLAEADHSSAEATIPGLPLGDIVGGDVLARARLIKIDVEGAEWVVLQGLLRDIALLPPAAEIVVEVNVEQLRADGRTLRELLATFGAHGFVGLRVHNTYEVREHLRPATLDLPPVDPDTDEQIDILFTRNAPRP